MRYVVIMERGEDGFGAYVPEFPGCVAVGETKEEALRLIGEAVELHLERLREDGLPIPRALVQQRVRGGRGRLMAASAMMPGSA